MDFMYLPYGDNSVSIYDGSVGRILNEDGLRYVNLFGGTIGQVSLAVDGGLRMRGGTIGGIDSMQAHAYIYDGLIDGNVEACQLVFHMSGGILRGDLIAQCLGYYPIDGFYIYGHGFEINGLPVGSGTYTYLDFPTGYLTGTLRSGDPIAVGFTLDEFQPLVLVIPAPGAFLLATLGAGLVGLISRRRTR